MESLIDAGTIGLRVGGVPPIVSLCGRAQPGFDPGPPETLDGEPYNEWRDAFCTITFTMTFFRQGSDLIFREEFYVVKMGEARRGAELRDWWCDGCYYGRRDSRAVVIDAPEVSLDPTVAQGIRYETMAVDGPAILRDGNPIGFVWPEMFFIRTTEPGQFNVIQENAIQFQNDTYRYQGSLGIPDTGGAVSLPTPGGMTQHYGTCDLVQTGEGNGFCRPDCRLFDPGNGLDLCTWQDLGYLPIDPELVAPDWALAHPEKMDRAYGASP
jgi:hypothetical protein